MARYIEAVKSAEIISEKLNIPLDNLVDVFAEIPTADVVGVEKYNDLRENFVDFACSGANNLAPYCKNRCVECVDERGWCKYGCSCKGFNPDGERRTDNDL